MQDVACAVRVRSCPQLLNSPPVNSQRFFLSEERGCSHDSGEKMKSRVKRVGVTFLEIYYKKEFLETGVKSLYFLA